MAQDTTSGGEKFQLPEEDDDDAGDALGADLTGVKERIEEVVQVTWHPFLAVSLLVK